MNYLITGGTGFIGRFFIENLLARPGTIHVLVRESSRHKLDELKTRFPVAAERIVAVIGDITRPGLGISDPDCAALKGRIDHFYHFAAVYDMAASEASQQAANIAGTLYAVQTAETLGVRCFHHVSSVAVSGLYRGTFREDMFDEAENLDHAYFRTKHESEKIVRQQLQDPVPHLPPRRRGRPFTHRRDRQDRRPLLLVQDDPAHPQHDAEVDAAGRRRIGREQRRASRLRGERDRLPLAPRGPGRRLLPHRRYRALQHRPDDEHLRRGGARAEVQRALRSEDIRLRAHRTGRPAEQAAAGEAPEGSDLRSYRHARVGLDPDQVRNEVRQPCDATPAGRQRYQATETRELTHGASGTTGSVTSTPISSSIARWKDRSRIVWC
jgi:hypothetical protein